MRIIRLQEKHRNPAAKVLAKAYSSSIKSVKKDITSKKRGEKWLVALDGKEVAGVLGYLFDYSHYANYIEDLAVAGEHRRKGIANALLKRFVEISKKEQPKKQPYCLSSTSVKNKASIKLHLGFGFRKLGTIKKLHYGEDEIIFGYRL
jgi:ribosomal protein S18 acetylase RimI-like enzyme